MYFFMNRQQAIGLANGLFSQSLKPKVLSTDNYISVHLIKIKLKKYLNEMVELENQLNEDYELDLINGEFPKPQKEDNEEKKKAYNDFKSKLKTIQGQEITIDKLNFIALEEFRNW